MTQQHSLSRKDDSSTQKFNRSGRFLCFQGKWYFKTREGLDYGPYSSRTECKYAFKEFIDLVAQQNNFSGFRTLSNATSFNDSETNWTIPKISFG